MEVWYLVPEQVMQIIYDKLGGGLGHSGELISIVDQVGRLPERSGQSKVVKDELGPCRQSQILQPEEFFLNPVRLGTWSQTGSCPQLPFWGQLLSLVPVGTEK